MQQTCDELMLLTQRLADSLVASALNKSPNLIQDAQPLLARLQPDGHWDDIDYRDQSLMGEWRSAAHLDRLGCLAAASHLANDAAGEVLAVGALRALDYWLEHDFTNPNWWWNQIGVPKRVGEALALLRERLTPTQLAAGVQIMTRNDWSHHTGQNLVWGVAIQLVRGCLAGARTEVDTAAERLAREIRIARNGQEGIQPDFSFHQHEAVLYSGGYGLNFACDCASLAAWLQGTTWALSPKLVTRLSAYLLEGQQWMVRGRTFDYSAVGREITRRGKSAIGLAEACADMEIVDADRRVELAAFRRRLQGQASPADLLTGNRHFWKSDFMTHQRLGYYASVRMFSNRLDSTDWVCGGEGKKSHYLADGATLLYRNGDEYRDIFPAWDWRRVPGTTVEYPDAHPAVESVRTRGTRAFVGGVSDGRYGMAAMDFQRDTLTARKACFFFDREFVCLGAGITCASKLPVRTSVEQCHACGKVSIAAGDSAALKHLKDGVQSVPSPRWVNHAGVGYLFLDPTPIFVGIAEQHGDWAEIGTGIDGWASVKVFNLWIEHGRGVTDAHNAYAVLPEVSETEMAAYSENPPVQILANTPSLQAVWHAELRQVQAAFYQPGTLSIHDRIEITVEQPCLLLLAESEEELKLTLANPENRSLTVNVRISLPLRGGGCHMWADGSTRITMRLPGGGHAGQSVSRRLTRFNDDIADIVKRGSR